MYKLNQKFILKHTVRGKDADGFHHWVSKGKVLEIVDISGFRKTDLLYRVWNSDKTIYVDVAKQNMSYFFDKPLINYTDIWNTCLYEQI